MAEHDGLAVRGAQRAHALLELGEEVHGVGVARVEDERAVEGGRKQYGDFAVPRLDVEIDAARRVDFVLEWVWTNDKPCSKLNLAEAYAPYRHLYVHACSTR